MIAASGSWFRIAHGLVHHGPLDPLLPDPLRRLEVRTSTSPSPPAPQESAIWPYPNIFVASLVLTGFVVARQVKRILALSKYYEHRQVL